MVSVMVIAGDIDWLIDWVLDWLNDWLIDWLIDWIKFYTPFNYGISYTIRPYDGLGTSTSWSLPPRAQVRTLNFSLGCKEIDWVAFNIWRWHQKLEGVSLSAMITWSVYCYVLLSTRSVEHNLQKNQIDQSITVVVLGMQGYISWDPYFSALPLHD